MARQISKWQINITKKEQPNRAESKLALRRGPSVKLIIIHAQNFTDAMTWVDEFKKAKDAYVLWTWCVIHAFRTILTRKFQHQSHCRPFRLDPHNFLHLNRHLVHFDNVDRLWSVRKWLNPRGAKSPPGWLKSWAAPVLGGQVLPIAAKRARLATATATQNNWCCWLVQVLWYLLDSKEALTEVYSQLKALMAVITIVLFRQNKYRSH